MNTSQINSLLRNCKGYIGAFARDLIPTVIIKKTKKPTLLIVNTDPSHKPGEHWITIYLDSKGSGEYFDSYGLPPLHTEIINFLNKMCPLGYGFNPVTLQCTTCITCGHYCVLFVMLRSLGYSYCDYISLFTNNTLKNENVIRKFVPL